MPGACGEVPGSPWQRAKSGILLWRCSGASRAGTAARKIYRTLCKASRERFRGPIQGELALSQGRIEEAIQRLQQATESFRRGGNHSLLISSDGLALAFERRGEPLEAIRVLEAASQERLLELAWDAQYGVFWLRIQAHMARLYRQLRRSEDARKIENQLRRILAYADADHPIRVQISQSSRASTKAGGII